MQDLSFITPLPSIKEIWRFSSSSAEEPIVSVVVSLYNYENCIIETLEKLAAQTLKPLELVVVDDASTDKSQYRVFSWLQENYHYFSSGSLLQHKVNGGLASARNTGFQRAKAPWIWVQDADNPITPKAIESCYCLAKKAASQVAVIHPLLLTVPEGASPDVFQGEGKIWQKGNFYYSNSVDAMALVRREAWNDVGGYVHIPDGWEDYDFWCSLIEKGWTGVNCPQVLAFYTCHAKSMTALTALPNLEKLQQSLQKRHPWLNCCIPEMK